MYSLITSHFTLRVFIQLSSDVILTKIIRNGIVWGSVPSRYSIFRILCMPSHDSTDEGSVSAFVTNSFVRPSMYELKSNVSDILERSLIVPVSKTRFNNILLYSV